MNADSLKYKIKMKSLQIGVFLQDLLQILQTLSNTFACFF